MGVGVCALRIYFSKLVMNPLEEGAMPGRNCAVLVHSESGTQCIEPSR